MRRSTFSILIMSAMWPASARAEDSDDLRFCGSLQSSKERLACYDAAARIAERSSPVPQRQPTVVARQPPEAHAAMPTKIASISTEPAPARNPFDGHYLAIGGGYGVGSGRNAQVDTFGSTPFTSASGPHGSLVLGTNIAVGRFIVGLEADGRFLGERADVSGFSTSGFPAFGSYPVSYNYRNDVGAHASFRFGASFDDLLVFAKAGVGVTKVRETFTADQRELTGCLLVGGFGNCIVPGPPGTLSSVRTESWIPSAIFGLGIEKNWGPIFGRIGADFEAFNHSPTTASGSLISGFSTSASNQITWASRGTAMIGVRF